MIESIYIKNVGPIKEVNMDEIKPFTLLIGRSATGKSTIMKIIGLFRYIFKRANIRSYLHRSKITRSPFRIEFKTLIRENKLDEMINSESLIIYKITINDSVYEIRYENNKLSNIPQIKESDLFFEKGAYISENRNIIPSWLEQYGKGTRMSLNFYFDETLRNFVEATDHVPSYKINFLKLDLKMVRGNNNRKRYILIPTNGRREESYDLSMASSGIKTTTPLAVLVKYFGTDFSFKDAFKRSVLSYLFDSDRLDKYKPTMDFSDLPKQVDLHVEEPELSLDPDSQMSLLDDLVDNAFHTISQDRKMTIMFATHSPYLLNYVNLLMAKNDLDKDKGLKPENTMVYIVDSGRLISVMGRDVKNRIIVDTNSMAEQMERIYNDYVEIRS